MTEMKRGDGDEENNRIALEMTRWCIVILICSETVSNYIANENIFIIQLVLTHPEKEKHLQWEFIMLHNKRNVPNPFLGPKALLTFCALLSLSYGKISLPFASLVMEIKPTLSIYFGGGDPPCFILEGGGSAQPQDLVRMAEGHVAWNDTAGIIFIVHGFEDSSESGWVHLMKKFEFRNLYYY
jgi:hypothetical protein